MRIFSLGYLPSDWQATDAWIPAIGSLLSMKMIMLPSSPISAAVWKMTSAPTIGSGSSQMGQDRHEKPQASTASASSQILKPVNVHGKESSTRKVGSECEKQTNKQLQHIYIHKERIGDMRGNPHICALFFSVYLSIHLYPTVHARSHWFAREQTQVQRWRAWRWRWGKCRALGTQAGR